MPKHRPYCLSIAGFDPSGGAGLIADAKVFEHLRVQGLFVQTSNTFQSEDEFVGLNWTASEDILQQLDLLLKRYTLPYIKIGLIENADCMNLVLKRIYTGCTNPPMIIWDPVLNASSGGELNENRFDEVEPDLMKNVIITPNRKEHSQLPEAILNACLGVYTKGGDSENNKGTDHFRFENKEWTLKAKQNIDGTFHGTGCHFSSAFLAHIANGYPPLKSALRSKRLLEKWLRNPQGLLAKIKN